MFRKLQTRLTVLYAALFGVVLLAIAVAVLWVVTDQARRQGESGLSAAGAVFERLWEIRAERLQVGATLLSRDYGFRQALATHDAPTVASAASNLRDRLGLDFALVVDTDGAPLSQGDARTRAAAATLQPALADGGEARGVVVVEGRPYEVVSAPILAPELKGWIVFGVRLDSVQMRALSRLSAVPLDAAVVGRRGSAWVDLTGGRSWRPPAAAQSRAVLAASPAGEALVLVRPLRSVLAAQPTALLLSYPMREALAPYHTLLWLLAAVGLTGLGLVVLGGWALARTITRPLSLLSAAARRLEVDGTARVTIASGDEVGELARGFNAMADAVAEREQRLRDAAMTDAETGLPNRPALEAAVQAGAASERMHVAAFGVERFARMRGAVGYDLSAELFRELGRRLASARPEWRVARTSADILGVAFAAPDADAARAEVEAAAALLEQPAAVSEQLIDVRVSIGLSTGIDPAQLVREADLALDAARAAAAPFAAFDPAASARAAESLQLMPALRAAVAGAGLSLAHQPKYDVRRRAITSVESLVRWTHPRLGPLPPTVFIGPAEETGEIRGLTAWVAERAVAEQAELAAAGWALPFSINLSGRLVGDEETTQRLLSLAATAAAPLCLEVTETAVIGNPEAALAAFARFREAGVAISIDDYGSGLSSLAYLKRIAANELKLDRSLVCDLAESGRDALLVRSTIDLAHGLGMKVVGEGVEDDATLAILAGLGCDLIQGYHVARPMPLEALKAYLSAPDLAMRA